MTFRKFQRGFVVRPRMDFHTYFKQEGMVVRTLFHEDKKMVVVQWPDGTETTEKILDLGRVVNEQKQVVNVYDPMDMLWLHLREPGAYSESFSVKGHTLMGMEI